MEKKRERESAEKVEGRLSCDGDLSFRRFLVKCQVISLLRAGLANEHHVTDRVNASVHFRKTHDASFRLA